MHDKPQCVCHCDRILVPVVTRSWLIRVPVHNIIIIQPSTHPSMAVPFHRRRRVQECYKFTREREQRERPRGGAPRRVRNSYGTKFGDGLGC